MKRIGFLGSVLVLALSTGQVVAPASLKAQNIVRTDSISRSADEQARVQALRAKIEQLKYQKLQQSLGMDDATAKQFFDIYKPAEKDIQDIAKQRNEEIKKLGQMINGAKTDADVDPEVAKIRDLNHQIENREMRLDSDLKPLLSPRQRAKLLVFENEFNKRVREEIMKRKLNQSANSAAQQQKLAERRLKLKQWLEKHRTAVPKAEAH